MRFVVSWYILVVYGGPLPVCTKCKTPSINNYSACIFLNTKTVLIHSSMQSLILTFTIIVFTTYREKVCIIIAKLQKSLNTTARVLRTL